MVIVQSFMHGAFLRLIKGECVLDAAGAVEFVARCLDVVGACGAGGAADAGLLNSRNRFRNGLGRGGLHFAYFMAL
jgi:hypothetical protein